MAELRIEPTAIPGLLVLHLPVHTDNRGWFKENWQRAKMVALGLPDFEPVQHNLSHNTDRGATRGIHAEPWDKLVSLAAGRVFGAWVDLRPGAGFGRVVTAELGPDKAVYVPKGVGNSYQALEDHTTYSYLVNQHWTPAARDRYTMVNLYDPALAIPWPIGRADAELSQADANHPLLADVPPIVPGGVMIVGAGGQLGQALQDAIPDARPVTRAALDITDRAAVDRFDWSGTDVIINAAAYSRVDDAETPAGRRLAWAVNAVGVANLAAAARSHRLGLVHISSDYVFDGTQPEHDEDEPPSPLGVYGQSKAAGDLAAATVARHWIVRTSWVVGAGANFVDTMARLAAQGVHPSVVDDQYGRLTFTDDLAAGIKHLLESNAPAGTYNLTGDGPVTSWADVAARVFELSGRNPADITRVTAAQWASGRSTASRPSHSTLRLAKIKAHGFTPKPADESLTRYLARARGAEQRP